jgi:hypothetical protein
MVWGGSKTETGEHTGQRCGRQRRKLGGISTGQQPCEREEKFLHGKLIWSAALSRETENCRAPVPREARTEKRVVRTATEPKLEAAKKIREKASSEKPSGPQQPENENQHEHSSSRKNRW